MVNSTLNPLTQLEWRYATKQFDSSKKLDAKKIELIEEALILSPSSFGLQPYKFIIISDDQTKEKLKPLSWNQPQITDCSHLIVFCRLENIDENYVNDFVEMTAKIRSMPLDVLEHYKSMMVNFVNNTPKNDLQNWMTKQAYIALGNLMTFCSLYDIDTCPMEGFNREEYDKLLNLNSMGLHSEVLLAVGYRDKQDKYAKLAKVRYPKNDKIIKL